MIIILIKYKKILEILLLWKERSGGPWCQSQELLGSKGGEGDARMSVVGGKDKLSLRFPRRHQCHNHREACSHTSHLAFWRSSQDLGLYIK